MEWVIKVGQLLLSLSLLIVLHEGGHFVAARMFKTRVEKFYLFFDFLFPFSNVFKFSIFKFKKGDTEYGLGWFPLGGYVKIAGMLDESDDKEALALPPKPDEFRSKKAWQRLIIILGGIIVNLVVGVLILWFVKFAWGDTYVPLSKVDVAITDSTLQAAGFRTGDRIVGYENSKELMGGILYDNVRTVRVSQDGAEKNITLSEDVLKHIIDRPKEAYFEPRVPFIIAKVPASSANVASGLQKGDRIVLFDSIPVNYYDELIALLPAYKNQVVDAKVKRGEDTLTLKLEVNEDGFLGVQIVASYEELSKLGYLPLERRHYSFFNALPAGFNSATEVISNYVKGLKLIFKPSTGAYKQVGGFASIASVFPAEWSWEAFWRITAFLSLVLAFMNFLPIPMLDGGYMVFILYEMITRRKPGEKFMEYANMVGFIIVMGLLVFANGNDLFKAIFGK